MFNLQKTKNLMFYSLISFCLTAYPALAQGEKIVENEQTMKVIINIFAGFSVLGTILTFVYCIMATRLALFNSDYSSISLSLIFCWFLVAFIWLSSFIIGRFVPMLAYAIAANCILIIWGLSLRSIRR